MNHWLMQLQYLDSNRYHRRQGILAADLGVSRQTLNSWLRCRSTPREKFQYRITELCNEVVREELKENEND